MFRLILALFIALLSLPMPAMACDGPMPQMPVAMNMPITRHATTGIEHKSPVPKAHDCIGCMPVAEWDGARLPALAVIAPPKPVVGIAAMSLLRGEPPTPPPPRIA